MDGTTRGTAGARREGAAESVEAAAAAPGGAAARRPGGSPRGVAARVRLAGERGMATAEYAIATVAAVGFAGLLIAVLRSDEVRALLAGIVRGALSV
jgi:hypothetical protein